MIGAGTGMPSLAPDPDSQDVSAQFFETRAQHFKLQNHLGTPQEPHQPGTPGKPEMPAPQPTAFDLAPIIELLRTQHTETLAEVRGIRDAIGKATKEIQKAGGRRAGEAEPVPMTERL